MKREFGRKLIESFFPSVDLTHVIDTSGAYIPGHGTPTVILVSRNRAPDRPAVRVVMGRRGEPTPPAKPEEGKVWRSIVAHVGRPGAGNEWIDVADLPRATFADHPWSVSDTLANELKLRLERNRNRLRSAVTSIGPASFTGTDDAFVAPADVFQRLRVDSGLVRGYVVGELIRDCGLLLADESVSTCRWCVRTCSRKPTTDRCPAALVRPAGYQWMVPARARRWSGRLPGCSRRSAERSRLSPPRASRLPTR